MSGRNLYTKQGSRAAFTIVELLIVVVVIAILAAITLVAYNGIQQSTRESSLQAELSQLAQKVETLRYGAGSAENYPATLSAAGYSSQSGNVVTYSPNNTANPKQFCADALNGTTSYYITQATGTPQPGSCSISNGLRGWWRLNGNPNDSSGNGYNGTVSGATLTSGQNGNGSAAYNFSPANSARIILPDTAALAGNPQYTISAWVKTGTAAAYGILGWGSFGTANSTIALRVSTQPGFQTYWWANDLNTPFAIADSAWHQVVTLYDGSTQQTYVDGVYINGRTPTAGHVAVATNMNIGRTSTTEYFAGDIDDVRLYDRALSASEIAILFAAGAQ